MLTKVGDSLSCEHQRPVFRSPVRVHDSKPLMKSNEGRASEHDQLPFQDSSRRSSSASSLVKSERRLSQRLTSISRHFHDRKASITGTIASAKSAPPSRTPSFKKLSLRRSKASQVEPISVVSNFSRAASQTESIGGVLSTASWPASPIDTFALGPIEEPITDPVERHEHSTTPLLPPVAGDDETSEHSMMQSPLQSPTVAPRSATDSFLGSPNMTPVTRSIHSPSLSARPSLASIKVSPARQHAFSPDTFEDADEWSIKLGHLNFNIVPEPYFPLSCDAQSCSRLLEDWKTAQVEYLRHAARICEQNGPTSTIYKLTQEKWEEIDSHWRKYFKEAQARAEANGVSPHLDPLEETQTFAIPDKFPTIDDADIVGPMSQNAPICPPTPSSNGKKKLLRLFTDPASLLRK